MTRWPTKYRKEEKMDTLLNNPPITRRSNLINWIIQHGLTLFFGFTFLLSWIFYGVAAIANLENRDIASIIILIGAYAPSISAIVLSAIANPEARKISASKWFTLFIPVLILATGIEMLDHIFWEHQSD